MVNYHSDAEPLVQHFPTDDAHSACSTLTVFVVYWMNAQRQGRKLPPGPKKYPFIGNLLSMPTTRMEDVCEVGTRIQSVIDQDSNPPLSIHLMLCTDSDIIHVNTLGTLIIILLLFAKNLTKLK